MSIGRRIKEARLGKGLSQEALAKLVGVSKGTIGNYEIDLSSPNENTLIALMDCLKVDANFLYQDDMSDEMKRRAFGGTDGKYAWGAPILNAYASSIRPTQEAACAVLGISHVEPSVHYPPSEPTCDILVYSFPAAAGIPLMAEDDYERLEFPESAVPSGADFGIRIRGDSMQPTIDDETIVFVRRQPDLQSGQIGIFMIDDEAVCKRLHKKGNTVSLKSDNHAYKDIVIQPYQRFYVVGKVLGYR
jgi:SOS-response transcriptional repressor LexA